jgi:hypothetical protein
MSCMYCGKKFGSAMSLASHMDRRHQGWVETILAHIGALQPAHTTTDRPAAGPNGRRAA